MTLKLNALQQAAVHAARERGALLFADGLMLRKQSSAMHVSSAAHRRVSCRQRSSASLLRSVLNRPHQTTSFSSLCAGLEECSAVTPLYL